MVNKMINNFVFELQILKLCDFNKNKLQHNLE